METDSLVHFDGPWQEAGKKRVRRAAARAEQAGLPTVETAPVPTAPWVAVCHAPSAEEASFYAASRLQTTEVLTAETAAGLAKKIRQFP